MIDSMNQPEIETLSYKSKTELTGDWRNGGKIDKEPANIPPATLGLNSAVIKPGMRVNKACPLKEPLKPSQQPICVDKCEQSECKTCAGKGYLVQVTSTANIGMLGGHTYPCPDCKPNSNLKIISEIEGLINKAHEKMYKLPYILQRKQAVDEIDLFKKTTLFELRRSFE